MLDLILKLIDRLIDLSKRREEVNRRTFSDFVQPAFEIFEKVHVDYIESLTRYITMLSDKALPLNLDHPVLKDMELDSLKTTHLRAKLEDITAETAPDKLRELLTAIRTICGGFQLPA